MFLKLEVAEERQTVVRCGGLNSGLVLPVETSAFREVKDRRDSPEVQRPGEA